MAKQHVDEVAPLPLSRRRRHEVQLAVGVQVAGGEGGPRSRTSREEGGGVERAVALAEQDRIDSAWTVDRRGRHREVELAVFVEVADGQGSRKKVASGGGPSRLERAVVVTQQHA